jgi:hypothetical protein
MGFLPDENPAQKAGPDRGAVLEHDGVSRGGKFVGDYKRLHGKSIDYGAGPEGAFLAFCRGFRGKDNTDGKHEKGGHETPGPGNDHGMPVYKFYEESAGTPQKSAQQYRPLALPAGLFVKGHSQNTIMFKAPETSSGNLIPALLRIILRILYRENYLFSPLRLVFYIVVLV